VSLIQSDDDTCPTLDNHEERFTGSSLPVASVDPSSCRWDDSFVERGVAPTRDHDVSGNTLSLFPSPYLLEPSEVMASKTIRFAEVIATDMESTPPDSSRDIPLTSSQQDDVSTIPNSGPDDSDCDKSKIMCVQSGDEDTIIRQHLYDAFGRAAVRDALGWTARKVLRLFHQRVEEEEEDRVGGGDLWGNNPIGDQLQIKDFAKGMFVKDENKESKEGAVVGAISPEVLSL